jgi:predicted 2-oxoglutarate/Fe(II)-dependent dioxygenase YbiX/peroxiredoxin
MILPGDPAPPFSVPSSVNPHFHFDSVAGRFVVLSFFVSSQLPFTRRLLEEVKRRVDRFDVTNVVFFGLSVDPQDPARLSSDSPGVIFFWDRDQAVSKKYQVLEPASQAPGSESEPSSSASPAREFSYAPQTLVIDHAQRVLAAIPFGDDAAEHLQRVLNVIDRQPKLDDLKTPAPVLLLPYVFEKELCQTLINYYQDRGGEDSGFMRDVNGKTVGIVDYSHKRRSDCEILDEQLIRAAQERIQRRIVPAIRQAFQFHVTRIERHIVACYDAATAGHFKAHRDNTTLATAHRRFAVTLNLNSDEFEGGELWFPEFSRQRYKAPTGGAVVFSCSLLHEATPVTKGTRYAFLPFLYDDAAARVRDRNRQHLSEAPPTKAMDTAGA